MVSRDHLQALDAARSGLRQAIGHLEATRFILRTELSDTVFTNDGDELGGLLTVRAWAGVLADLLGDHASHVAGGVLSIIEGGTI